MKRRVTYRPSKASGVLSAVVGVIFTLIGLFVVIPRFGSFGVLWTLIAIGGTAVNIYQVFGKGYVGPRIEIEEEGTRPTAGEKGADVRRRLEQLEALKEAGLITGEEYQQKRQEILRDL